MKRFYLTMLVVMTLLLSQGLNVFAFDPVIDGKNYDKVNGTNLYVDGNTSTKEVADVHHYWNMIPTPIKELMYKYNIKLYLVGDGSNLSVSTTQEDYTELEKIVIDENSPDLIPIDVANGPAFIEKDPYDVNNIKIVELNGEKKLLWHGYYMHYNEKTFNLEQVQQMYLEAAPEFGMNLVNSLKAEAKAEDQDILMPNSTVGATSWGPSVKYDSWNNYKLVEVVKDGWTEYYSNNPVYIPENIIHEVGHHLDWLSVPESGYYGGTLFGISDGAEWQGLYKKNIDKLATIDALSSQNVYISASEGFADAFRLAYQKPDRLKEVCPDVYNFVINTVNKYNKGSLETFDYVDYADRYPDVKEAYGYDANLLYEHWITHGMHENRTARFIE